MITYACATAAVMDKIENWFLLVYGLPECFVEGNPFNIIAIT